jgi:hypothetical protein
MAAIASRYGLTLNTLLACNPQITNPDLIFPGDAAVLIHSMTSTCFQTACSC